MSTTTPSVSKTQFDRDPRLKELHGRLLAMLETPDEGKATLFRGLAAQAMAYANELEEPDITGVAKKWNRIRV